MTHPGGGSNEINLAALWIPVMPETSHMGEEMEKSGKESKRRWEQGFNSGSSPESIGQSYGSKLAASIGQEFQRFELPFGASGFLDKFSNDIDQKLVSKLRGEASSALQAYRGEFDNLTAAQERNSQAESKLAQAREGGYSKASIMLPLIQEQTAASNNLTTATANAAAAHDNFTQKQSALNSEMSKTADGGKILAGIMGGAMVIGAQLAVQGIEHIVEAIAEGFTKGIELTVELAKTAVELGETYEHIGIQIHEFSTAAGEDFARTEEAAQHVFSTLDVAGNDVGKTMAQLSSMMDVPGEHIQGLVRNVTELQGRFTSLKATDLGSTFVAFNVPAEQADKSLASLLQSARGAGQDLGQLASTLSGNVALTLHEAGMSIEQAGKFTADLMQKGEPGRQAMTGMAMAMKEFGKEGISFSDGMKEAGAKLNELGDTAAGQDLAQKLFGARNWIVAKDAVKDYLNIIGQAPDAFSATTASTQEFLDQTATLGNKIDEFKHKAEEAFKPFGDAAKNVALSGLNSISTWFSTHHHEIIEKIKDWGNKLIDMLPTIQTFTADGIRMFGDFTTALLMMFSPVAQTLAVAGAGFLALSGHFKDAKDLLMMVQNFDPGKIKDATDKIADNIQNFKFDSQSLHDSWNGIADAADRVSATVGSGLGSGLSTPFNIGPGGGMPGMPGASGGGGPAPAPGAWFPGGGGGGGGGGVSMAPGGHHADWDAIAAQESTGRWNEVLKTGVIYGGGLQIKPETWYEFGGLAFAQLPYQASKEDQIKVAERILNGWGSNPGQGPKAWDNGKTYVERKQLGGPITSGSGQGDDVAALLGKGEYVWDTATVDKYGWLIKALHQGGAMGFGGGGSGSADYAAGGGKDDLAGVDQQIAFAEQIAKGFGLTLTAGKSGHGTHQVDGGYHDSGEAGDFSNGMQTDAELAFAMYMIEHFGSQLAELIHTDPRLPKLIKDGRLVDPSFYGADTLAGHKDHVHIAIKATQAMSDLTPGSESLSGGVPPMPAFGGAGATPGGGGGGQYPGIAGQYGGFGAYGGETADQRAQLDKAVRDATQRKADLDHQVIVSQRSVDDLKDKIAHVGESDKLDAFGKPYPLTAAEQAKVGDKRKKLQEQLDDATYALEKSQREAADANTGIADATRKQTEGAYKKPSGAGTSGSMKAPGESEFQQLGSGFLKGIGQELGFGDIFGKAPWEWGAVKLLTGAASWAIGTANAWGDYLTKGSGGGGASAAGGGGDMGGLLSGLTGSLGLNLPKANVSNGPNIVPQQPPGPFGPPTGPAPGPVIQGDYQPIHVSSDVNPAVVQGITTEAAAVRNSSMYQYQGGVQHT